MKKLSIKLEELSEIAERQLNGEEIMLLALAFVMEPPDIAEALGTSRQAIHQKLEKIDAKVQAQLKAGV